jgi:hypothetical protein
MYIDTVPNRNSPPAVLLRESYRRGSRVLKRTLANLSEWPPAKIQAFRRLLRDEPLLPPAQLFQIERSLPHGHVQAVLGLMRKLGVDTLLGAKRSRARDLALAMIAERLVAPVSKLATTRLWHSSTLAEELGVGEAREDELYAALDWLLERQAAIEAKLAARHLQPGACALYDVSSSYYYGQHCPLARYGHDRDGKRGLPVLLYGVLGDREGRPVAVQVYAGNTGDPTTVPDQVRKLQEDFGLARIVLVGDRGMLTETQIENLRAHPGLGWISALRSPAIRELVARGHLERSLFDQQNLAEIRAPDFPGERLIACYNPLLAEERRRKRAELLEATEKDLARLSREVARRTRRPLKAAQIGLKAGRMIQRFKMGKHFSLEIADGRFAFARDAQSIGAEEVLDGLYVIRTSEQAAQFDAAETVRAYKSLARIERAFRCLKGLDLRIRPIFLRTEAHVRGHVLVCLLAYYVEWHMRQALAPLLFEDEELPRTRPSRDPVAPAEPSESVQKKKASKRTPAGEPVHSFASLLEELATLCRNTCSLKSAPAQGSGERFKMLTRATPLQRRVFDLLGV